jgi:hypothetical protein
MYTSTLVTRIITQIIEDAETFIIIIMAEEVMVMKECILIVHLLTETQDTVTVRN